MTTPRDDIDGLIERLRSYEGRNFETTACYNGLRDEAATAIDALQARVKELEARARHADKTSSIAINQREQAERNRDMWKGQCKRQAKALSELRVDAGELVVCQYALSAAESRALRAEQERDELHDDGLKWAANAGQMTAAFEKELKRAEKAEQERDEAVALLVRVNALAQTQAWRRMPDGATFSTTPLAGDINATIRRLAGPEKEGK